MVLEEEYLCHLLELKKEWAHASPNEDHVKMLFQDTFFQRRKYLTSLPTGKVTPILEKFPCLEDGSYVSTLATSNLLRVGMLYLILLFSGHSFLPRLCD